MEGEHADHSSSSLSISRRAWLALLAGIDTRHGLFLPPLPSFAATRDLNEVLSSPNEEIEEERDYIPPFFSFFIFPALMCHLYRILPGKKRIPLSFSPLPSTRSAGSAVEAPSSRNATKKK